jgi:DNA helicase IV
LNEDVDLRAELAAEQANLDRLYARLDGLRSETRARLEAALKAEGTDTPGGLAERDAVVRLYEQRLAMLEGVDERLCFGRLDLRDGERLYIGRVGLADARNQPLLVDWRAPVAAAFYQATAAAPGEVVRRRHLTTRDRRVVAIEDEALDLGALDAAERRHLVGEGALLVAVEAARTGRMGDILATIQVEQDRIVRDALRGILVVQGGPGTGKTVVALHRTAYLLYTHRDKLERSGVLLVGPSPVFLRYIERVLPSLGETGVVMATPGALFPGVKTVREDPPATASLKGDLAMVPVLERAIRHHQRVPKAPVAVEVDGRPLSVPPAVFEASRAHARASGRRHNAARPLFVRHIYRQLIDLLAAVDAPGEQPDEAERRDLLEALLESESVRQAVHDAWPPLTAPQLLAGLLGGPRRLAAAAPGLGEAERALLLRPPEAAGDWTVSDVPLLDEAAELLGTDDTLERQAARQAKSRRRHEVAYARGALQVAGGLAAALVSAEALADRFADAGPRRTVAEQAAEDRGWAFGHVVVDEAQELSPMAWRLLMRRNPERSMTLVGDIAQTGSPAGTDSWAAVLAPYVGDRWRLAELSTNYRTPGTVMDLAAAVLGAAGLPVRPPTSVRPGEPPVARPVPAEDLPALVALVQAELARLGERRLAVIAPSAGAWAAPRLAEALAAALPPGTVGQGASAIDAAVAVLEPRQSKGLEVDVVLLVEPAEILAGSERGANDLYVALTRPTQRLVVAHSAPLPPGMASLEAPKAPT